MSAIWAAPDPARKFFVLLFIGHLHCESLNSVRTYVRFVCECGHRAVLCRLRVVARSDCFYPILRCWLNICASRINGQGRAAACTVPAVKKARIDAVLAERGLFPSRSAAAGAVRAGEVRVGEDGPVALRPSQLVEPEAALIVDEGPRFVSRGGIKLDNALEALGIDVAGLDCLDVGASTGGFTDCLLQRGAARVAALDVAYGQIDLRLREDPRVTVIERLNARELTPADLPFAPELATVDVSFISLAKVLPAVAALPGARRRGAGDGQAAVRAGPRAGRQGRRPRRRRPPRGDPRRGARRRASSASPVRGFASSGLPGPKGNRETFVWCGGDGEPARRPRGRDRARWSRERVTTAALITHSHPPATTEAVAVAVAVAREAGWRLVATAEELAKHGDAAAGVEAVDALPARRRTSAWCSAATARSSTRCAASPAPASRSSASTSAPSASSPRSSATRPRRGSAAPSPARPRRSSCPASRSRSAASRRVALNDVSFTRRPHDRVAELSYKIAGEEVGHVRCDGLVAATPAGSTGYNLANQGPILAWGVKGYVVSYIAPHSLTARALVVAPGDVLHVGNAGRPRAGRRRGRRRARRRAGAGRGARGPLRRRRRPARPAARDELLPAHPREVRPPGRLSRKPSAAGSLGCAPHGAQVVDPRPDLDRDVHAAAGHHGRQRRPARHPARTRRQPLQPAVGRRRLLADARRLPAHRRLARRPARPPARLLDRLRRSSPSPRSSAGSPATRPCSTWPAACRGSAARRCSPPRWR